jgi:phospholipid/cholesterol/gamma-HCH transport system permease protein
LDGATQSIYSASKVPAKLSLNVGIGHCPWNCPKGTHLSDTTQSDPRAWYRAERQNSLLRLSFGGEWTIDETAPLDASLRALQLEGMREVEIDGAGITRMDSTGAWLLVRTEHGLAEQGAKIRALRIPENYRPLIAMLEREPKVRPAPSPPHQPVIEMLNRIGQGTCHILYEAYQLLGFLGRISVETFEALIRPDRELPWPAFINQIEQTGVTALPIVGLLSFLIGVVLAYQGADQLARFGAEIFTVNLVGISVFREIGGLMTAIIVAGRSGSAFTAQIGTMKLNQEIDAMETIGVNPVEVLVLPRVLGLMVTLPLLTFYANVMGIIGGAVMCYFDLGITVPAFMRQLHDALTFSSWSFWLGLIKAPIFAAIIALVGCFEGLRVEGNAGSVGRLTTRSVVESVFFVIVLDAAFSILFSLLGI